MEEDLNYANVTFIMNDISSGEKPANQETVYAEVTTEQKTWDTQHVITESKRKTPHILVLASLGVLCFILMSVIVSLSAYIMHEKRRQNVTLTVCNQKLHSEREALKRRTEALIRERDRLNWTMGVILEYQQFQVKELCPQKECKPCLENWVLFQSKCYLFTQHEYYSQWKNWKNSQEFCQEKNGDLVVIQSQEEQEFLNNHTKTYSDENHGYWIGLSNKNSMETSAWVDGSNVTVMFWKTEQLGYSRFCVLSNPHSEPSANWDRASCDMRNRWICESRALIGPD